MKAIIIKDDRDIRFLHIPYKRPYVYISGKVDYPKVLDETEVLLALFPVETYELICVRSNGDLVYRLKR